MLGTPFVLVTCWLEAAQSGCSSDTSRADRPLLVSGICVRVYTFSNAHTICVPSCAHTYLWHTTSCDTGKNERTLSRSSSLSFEKWSTEDGLLRLLDGTSYDSSSSLGLFTMLCDQESQEVQIRMRSCVICSDHDGHTKPRWTHKNGNGPNCRAIASRLPSHLQGNSTQTSTYMYPSQEHCDSERSKTPTVARNSQGLVVLEIHMRDTVFATHTFEMRSFSSHGQYFCGS